MGRRKQKIIGNLPNLLTFLPTSSKEGRASHKAAEPMVAFQTRGNHRIGLVLTHSPNTSFWGSHLFLWLYILGANSPVDMTYSLRKGPQCEDIRSDARKDLGEA